MRLGYHDLQNVFALGKVTDLDVRQMVELAALMIFDSLVRVTGPMVIFLLEVIEHVALLFKHGFARVLRLLKQRHERERF